MKKNSVVLVTGAGRGIGKAIALAFARKKYCVAVNYFRSQKEAEALCQEIAALGAEAFCVPADVGDPEQVDAMVQTILQKWGALDVLVNNAGLARDRTILKMSNEEWNQVLRVNLSGSFWCLRAAAQAMSKNKSGSILNLGSYVGQRGAIGCANYAAAKAGLLGLTKSAARELGRFNVRVNLLFPGFHVTDLNREFFPTYEQRIRAEHALPQMADLSELADFAVTLAEQKSVSGQVFNFDSRIL